MQKKSVILIIILLAVLGLGFVIGKSNCLKLEVVKNQVISDLEQKIESKVKKGLIIFLDVIYDEKVARTSLGGEVIKIEGNTLTLNVANYYQGGKFLDYLNEPDYYQKKVKVEKDAEIVKLTIKEMPESPFSPDEAYFPFEEEEASFSELKEGMKVHVEAKSEFDLAGTDEILAKKIEIHE